MVFFGRVGVEKKKLQKMRSFNLFFSSYMEHGCDAWRFSSHIAIMRLTKHTKEVRVKRQKELSMVFLPLDFFFIITYSKGDQSWVFFGRNDAKAETPVLWPPHAKS